MFFMQAAVLLILLIALAYIRAPKRLWIPGLGIVLLIYSGYTDFSWAILGFLWLLFIGCVIIFTLPVVRRRHLIPKILSWFQTALPAISDTERQALEAGDVYWEKELFSGQPDWRKLSSMPQSVLSEVEQAFLNNQVENLCAMLDDWESVTKYRDLSPAVWDYLKQQGFFGLQIAPEYGGHGFSVWAHSHIITKIASRSVSAAITVMVPNALGPAEFLRHFGTDEQKQYYLPRLACGEEIPAFALTSLAAGSDATALTDSGVVCKGSYAGEEIIGIRLNWHKRYITLAPIATLLGLAFKLYDPDHLLGDIESIGISLCLVPTTLAGVKIGARHFPAGLAFLNGPTQGENVFIPLDFIIGGPARRGQGWQMMMEGLAEGRGISLPALSTAGAKLCYRMTGAYARLRQQFHQPIGCFEGVANILGRMGGLTYLLEATRHFTLGAIAQGVKPSLGAAISKYHLTELARLIANDAMDIHGGYATQLGPRNYLGLLYQSLPLAITVEGANILTRNLIIFGQGALRCHPFVHQAMKASQLSDKVQRLANFDRLVCGHFGYALGNLARTFIYGLTGGRLIRAPQPQDPLLSPYYRQLTRMSMALALTSDIVFAVLGKQLKRKEAISARLGDVLSHLYLASAVIKYYQSQARPQEDQIFVRWTLTRCLQQIQQALEGTLQNFTPRWLGRTLYWLIFPWGRAYFEPADTLNKQIAVQMMRSSPQRDRLTEYCYVGKGVDDPTGRVELALQALEKIQRFSAPALVFGDDFLVQLQLAAQAGVMSAEELSLLTDFIALRDKALEADEFSAEFF